MRRAARACNPPGTRVDALHFLNDLNEAQRRAVETTEGPLLVLAGAGSGKTRVITCRIGYLRARGLARPEEIVALTFTNKAAEEMRGRVEKMLGERPDGMWVGTFHSLGVRILRREAARLGYRPGFQIYDSADQLALVKECLREIQVSEQNFPPRSILARIGAAKSARQSPAQVPRRDHLEEVAARAYEVYERRLREAGAFDFDDLILRPLELFERFPDLSEEYSRRARYLLVDEYQDTDHTQYLLVRELGRVHGNVCVVGDEDQSIYRWRGADIRNILDFERDFPNAQIVKLEKNYRSTGTILQAASAVIENNRSRIGKRLWTDNPQGPPVEVITAEDDLDEARTVVRRIESLRQDPDLGGFAVLYRTNSQSRPLEEALVARGIPYRVVGALRFYERKEVKDLLAYLKFVSNPDDTISLRRVVNVPPRAIGGVAEAALEGLARGRGVSPGRALEAVREAASLPPRSREALDKLAALARGWRDELESLTVSALIGRIVTDTRYVEYLEKSEPGDAEERAANLEELRRAAEDSGTGAEGLQFFLDRAALVADTDNLGGEEGVTLLTLHSAKGLEFPVVFIAGMEEGLFPHSRALDSSEGLEEERRLCYVGFTRARRRLVLTHALRRLVHGVPMPQEPSRFLNEVPSSLVEVGLPDSSSHPGRRGLPLWGESPAAAVVWGGGARRERRGSFAAYGAAPAGRRGRAGHGVAGAAGGAAVTRRGGRGRDGTSETEPAGVVFGAADWSAEGSSAFPLGARVEHPKFGRGQVERVEGAGERLKLTIHFQGYGRKKILPHYAALRRIG
jgi:DNA helicase-2/ATP-dependent DNA helicase PcrA